jgi:hypothetical protein
VKSGGTYLFFVELADIFEVDEELAKLEEGTLLEEKVNAKTKEMLAEFRNISQDTKETGYQEVRENEDPLRDSGEENKKVKDLVEDAGNPEENSKEEAKENAEKPEEKVAKEVNTEENKTEAPQTDPKVQEEEQTLEEDLPPRVFVKRVGDKDNVVVWVEGETLLREREARRGSVQGDNNFHTFTLNIIYHPLFQQRLREWGSSEENK